MTRVPPEQLIEDYLARRVKETGGEVRKVVFPGRRGAPDRLCGWPSGNALVEVKRPGETAKPHQLREHVRLRGIGFRVDVIDTKEGVDLFVEEMAG